MSHNLTRSSIAFLALSALLGCGKGGGAMGLSSAAPAIVPVTLVRTFKADEDTKYKMTMNMDMSMTAPGQSPRNQTMTMTADVDQKVTKVAPDGKSAELTTKTTNMKMTPAVGAAMGDMTTTMTMDSRGNVTLGDMKTPGSDQMQSMFGSNMFGASFPDHPVKVGDSWEIPFPKMPMIEATGTMKATFLGEKAVGGTAAWEIKLTGTIPIKINVPGAKAPSDGTMTLDFDTLLDKSSCLIISSKGNSSTKMKMNAGPSGKMDMDQKVSISMEKAA